ncbi:TIR domain-containing protein [Marinicella rhabdoformis]|uniref:TIR domain-containing protein n=1 Tax=Marinicella rhabdoformis TaxID=2580566 RepID=UPI0012AEC7C8|nr:nucleotide-binding protein [Marinicella rhabdoformis]
MKYEGNLDDLKTKIIGCGFTIKGVKNQEHGYQIRTNEGAIVNWYQTTGKLQIQGKKANKEKLQDAWSTYNGLPSVETNNAEAPEPSAPENPINANKKVFVVHGHDTQAREQLELILHKLGLDPFVLANTGGGGLTIIEALEAEIGTNNNQARFGIVLMTPDDMGYSKADGTENIQPRARQNVVLEMGMLISAVGRGNVAILKKGHLEAPSDAQGILYVPFNEHVKEVVPKLADRFRAAGFVLNPEKITNASS